MKSTPDTSLSDIAKLLAAVALTIVSVFLMPSAHAQDDVSTIFESETIEKIVENAINPRLNTEFGYAASISGNRVAVSATQKFADDWDGSSINDPRGAVYIFDRDSNGDWVETFEINRHIFAVDKTFGQIIILQGDRLVVAARKGVYIYQYDGTMWLAKAALALDEGINSLLMEGDTLFIGTRTDRVDIYELSAITQQWALTQALTFDDGRTDAFGQTIALAGNSLFISAPLSPSTIPGNGAAGRVFRYENVEGEWQFSQELTQNILVNAYAFGALMAAGDDFLIVNSAATGDEEDDEQELVMFEDVGGSWEQTQSLEFLNFDPEVFTSEFTDIDFAVIENTLFFSDNRSDNTGSGNLVNTLRSYQRNDSGEWQLIASFQLPANEKPDRYANVGTSTSDDQIVTASLGTEPRVYVFGVEDEVVGSNDSDNDGTADIIDNCPNTANADQLNTDGDLLGDACDTDDDGDGVLDVDDAFPRDASEQSDTDGDLVGDISDNCPSVANADQINSDTDSSGDACDLDDDNDTVVDTEDAFPLDPTESVDTDNDGTGNNADTDDDNDNVLDTDDAFPLDASETVDTDNDGTGNNADTDDDNDTVLDADDAFPLDASEQSDADSDAIGDKRDNCPTIANNNQLDTDNNGVGDACEVLADDDGIQSSLESVSNSIEALASSATGLDAIRLNTALNRIDAALNDRNWVSASEISSGYAYSVFGNLNSALSTIERLANSRNTDPALKSALNDLANSLVNNIRLLTANKVEAATGNSFFTRFAQRYLDRGDDYSEQGRLATAGRFYYYAYLFAG